MAGNVIIGGGSCNVEHTLKDKDSPWHDKEARKVTVWDKDRGEKTYDLNDSNNKGELVRVKWE